MNLFAPCAPVLCFLYYSASLLSLQQSGPFPLVCLQMSTVFLELKCLCLSLVSQFVLCQTDVCAVGVALLILVLQISRALGGVSFVSS